MDARDIVILGSGPAGCTAAIYTARAGYKPLIITGNQQGGQLIITSEVENYPGFLSISGPDLVSQMREQALAMGAELDVDSAVGIIVDSNHFILSFESGNKIETKCIIISTGASAKWLEIPGEKKYTGRGVSACATCDGFFFKNKKVVVVGGGDTAVEEAIYLSNIATSVTVIHRRDSLKAEKIMQDRMFVKDNIDIIWNSKVNEIYGDGDSLTGIKIENVLSGEINDYKTDAVFVAIGHSPNTSAFQGVIDLDENGYVITKPWSTATSTKGIFAAGDVRDTVFKQAITAAGQGCMAALEAERYLGSGRK